MKNRFFALNLLVRHTAWQQWALLLLQYRKKICQNLIYCTLSIITVWQTAESGLVQPLNFNKHLEDNISGHHQLKTLLNRKPTLLPSVGGEGKLTAGCGNVHCLCWLYCSLGTKKSLLSWLPSPGIDGISVCFCLSNVFNWRRSEVSSSKY